MQNNIQVFNHQEFGTVRIVNIDGATWFVGKDVASALGYSNVKNLPMRYPEDLKTSREI
jgi:prophage antirepressor-like protein